MLTLPPDMQADLDGGVTSHCWCWRVVRADDAVFGFTDHDRDLVFDGTSFTAASGFDAGVREAETGFAPGHTDIAGVIDSALIAEADLEAGLWDGARVETFRVDWRVPARRVKTGTGTLDRIKRVDGRFEAELLGLEHALEREAGRVFSRRCDADLGDDRCGVAGSHSRFSTGCDKRLSTCRDRFDNALNFRGFPYMIGNDVLQVSPTAEPVRDGGSRGLAE